MADAIDTQPDAADAATPEGKVSDPLRDALGDQYEAFEAFRESQEGWNSQQNKHNEAAAEARREAEKVRDEMLKALAEVQAARTPQQPQGNGKRVATGEEFARVLGIDTSVPDFQKDAMTIEQAYALYAGATQEILNAEQEADRRLSKMEEGVDAFTSRFQKSEQGFAQWLAEAKYSEYQEIYPEADREEFFAAIRDNAELEGEDFNRALKRAAEQSHAKWDGKLSARAKSKKERAQRSGAFRGTGKSSAVAAVDMPKDVRDPDFMRQFMQRHPPPSSGQADEELT